MTIAFLVISAVTVPAFLALKPKPQGDMILHDADLSYAELQKVPLQRWHGLSTKRIYFGHKSVGAEVLIGVKDLQAELQQINLRIFHGDPASLHDNSGLAESSIGANFDPESKIDDFAAKLLAAGPNATDVAIMKFCYVDIDRNTDVGKLFAGYKATIANLQEKLPQTTLIHCTVPLTSRHNSLKAVAKRLLRRAQDSSQDNLSRERFNEMMRAEYRGKQAIIDIAAVESTLPDGQKVSDGGIPCLAACYTYDGGHLNEVGRRVVATEFLRVLAGLSH